MISDKSLSDRQPCADLFDLAYRLNHIKNDKMKLRNLTRLPV